MEESPLSHKYTKVEDKVDLMVKESTKLGQIMDTGDIVQIIVQGKTIEATDLEEISEGTVDKIIEKVTEMKDMVITIEIGIDQRKGLLQGVTVMEEIEAPAMTGLRSGSRASTNRDRIRCYACREYDHFVRDCPNSKEERDLEQLQHMLNMEEQDH